MDYLQIIINGITDQNAQKHLTNYFIREFKKAKKEHYTLTEFFDGCKSVIDGWEQELKAKYYKEINEHHLAIALLKDGEMKPAKREGDEHKTAEQRINEAVEQWEKQLAFIKDINEHSLHLPSVTNGRLFGNVNIDFIENLKQTIQEAFNQISLPPLDLPKTNKEEYNKMFAVSKAKIYVYDAITQGTTQHHFDRDAQFDLRNYTLYDTQDEIIKEGTQLQYNSEFLMWLRNAHILNVKDFLNHHFEKTPNKTTFLDYVEYGIATSESLKDGKKELIKNWCIEKRSVTQQ